MGFIQFLKVLGTVLTALLVFHELLVLIAGYRNAKSTTQEQWGSEPLTFGVRFKLFLVESMWRSYWFSDGLKRKYKVPNYPIRTVTMSFGGMVGYLTYCATNSDLLAAVGAAEGAALMTGLGAMLALRQNEGYLAAKKAQAELQM